MLFLNQQNARVRMNVDAAEPNMTTRIVLAFTPMGTGKTVNGSDSTANVAPENLKQSEFITKVRTLVPQLKLHAIAFQQ